MDILALYSDFAREAYARYREGTLEDIAQEFRTSFEQALTRVPEGHPWHASVVATLAHGGVGPGREARLQIQPWGFSFAGIRVPVGAWHAREDDMVPFDAAEASLRKLSTATLHIQQEPQHMPSDEAGQALFRFLDGG
ncbi:hypothetical protein [Myxococcus qinghaiensis]|uniref:hypothetical protein n=1 Tax=Myxococcus qinghaiensis TaxID=2906758 RepID=UPI0020A76DE9|nr:hypothetical protein [Myxococcus qinghaiensis]MCP3165034.1 hypothetical protein [Myxococcus qinghaiensis]